MYCRLRVRNHHLAYFWLLAGYHDFILPMNSLLLKHWNKSIGYLVIIILKSINSLKPSRQEYMPYPLFFCCYFWLLILYTNGSTSAYLLITNCIYLTWFFPFFSYYCQLPIASILSIFFLLLSPITSCIYLTRFFKIWCQ